MVLYKLLCKCFEKTQKSFLAPKARKHYIRKAGVRMAGKKSGKLSLVQASRGLAILFVLIGHINLLFYSRYEYDWFDMGRWERTGGVDFFFVVTGFMIYYLYHRHIGNSNKAAGFLLKRLIRIFPMLWIFTVLSAALYNLVPGIGNEYSAEVVLKSLILYPMKEPVLSSAWSLSHVVFFYLIFSCLMFSPKIFKPAATVWALITVVLEIFFRDSFSSFFFSFSTLEIVAGSLVAYMMLTYRLGYSTLLIYLGLSGYLTNWLNYIYSYTEIHAPLLYCISAMLIMLGISIKDRTSREIPKSISFIGDASYSIYITHGPLLQLYLFIYEKLHIVEAAGYFLSMCIVILSTVLSACFIYKSLEKPMSQKLRQLAFGKSERNRAVQSMAKTS